jgi:hypothetical protein
MAREAVLFEDWPDYAGIDWELAYINNVGLWR